MPSKLTHTAASAAFALALSLTAFAQQDNPAERIPPATTPGQETPVPAERNFEGHLTKVNLAARIITVKGADDKEMMFVYNDETQLTGIDNTPQGLVGKTGTRLKVTYKESRGINLATKLEGSPTEPLR
jgi:hypothetical protein